MLPKLKELRLSSTQITDAGCAALASALDSGVLPALDTVDVDDTPTSAAARAAVTEALVEALATSCIRHSPDVESDEDEYDEYDEYDEEEEGFGGGCGCPDCQACAAPAGRQLGVRY